MSNKVNNKIKQELEDSGYDFAVAVATKSELENGAACGQLSIITESENETVDIKLSNTNQKLKM